jgi:hypothetical protein
VGIGGRVFVHFDNGEFEVLVVRGWLVCGIVRLALRHARDWPGGVNQNPEIAIHFSVYSGFAQRII